MALSTRIIKNFGFVICIALGSCGKDLSQKFSTPPPSTSGLVGSGATASFHQGYNQLGQFAKCPVPKEKLICTLEFTASEQFSAKCKTEEGKSFTCGCHQYLCSKKIFFP